MTSTVRFFCKAGIVFTDSLFFCNAGFVSKESVPEERLASLCTEVEFEFSVPTPEICGSLIAPMEPPRSDSNENPRRVLARWGERVFAMMSSTRTGSERVSEKLGGMLSKNRKESENDEKMTHCNAMKIASMRIVRFENLNM